MRRGNMRTLGRMRYRLTVAGDLGHDGDHLTRYQFTAESAGFYGSTLVWGDGSEHNNLADALRHFPSSVPSSVDFEFGGAGIGSGALYACLIGTCLLQGENC
jgi:hypothetical protein